MKIPEFKLPELKMPEFKLPELRMPQFAVPEFKMPELHIGDLVARVPIIQGGMGVGISLSGLASAVANEGGIGVIAAAMIGFKDNAAAKDSEAHVRALENELRAAREKTDGIIGVNIMVALTNFADMVRTSVRERADIIFSGAGLPLDLPGYLTDGARTKLAPIVSSGRAAAINCKKWPLALRLPARRLRGRGAQSGRAPGLQARGAGQARVRAGAAGGRRDPGRAPLRGGKRPPRAGHCGGRRLRRQRHRQDAGPGRLGRADGHPLRGHPRMRRRHPLQGVLRQRHRGRRGNHQKPVGLPGRAVHSKFLDAVREGRRRPFRCPFHCIKTCDITKSPYCIAAALTNAVKGKLENGFAFAGANVHRVKEIVSVGELIDSLKAEYAKAMGAKA